jgi:Putative Ig domain
MRRRIASVVVVILVLAGAFILVGDPLPAAAQSNPAPAAIAWAQRYLNEDFDFEECLYFVQQAYSAAGVDIGSADTAADYWTQDPEGYTEHPGDTSPPAGALVFWAGTASNTAGHVGIYVGNAGGYSDAVISTWSWPEPESVPDVHYFSLSGRNAAGYPYDGWMAPPGVTSGGAGTPANGQLFVQSNQTQQYIYWYGASLPVSYGDAIDYDNLGYAPPITISDGFVNAHPASNLPLDTVVEPVDGYEQYLYTGSELDPIGDPATSACLLYVFNQSSPAVVPTLWSDPISVGPAVPCNLPNGTIEVEGSGTAASQYFTWGSDVLPVTYGDAVAYGNADYPAAIVLLAAGYAADHTVGMPADTIVRAPGMAQQYLWNDGTLQPVGDPATSQCLIDDGASGVAVVPPSWLNAQTVDPSNVTCNLPNGTIEVEGSGTAASQYFTWGSDVLPVTYGDAVAYGNADYPAAIVLPAGYAANHTLGMPANTVVLEPGDPAQYLWTGTTLEPVTTTSLSTCLLDSGSSGLATVPPSWFTAQTVSPTSPLCIETATLPSGVLKTAYSATLQAVGGDPPYKWSLASGSGPLPPGLELNKSTGTISGRPKTAGTYSFTLRVVDTKTKTEPPTRNKATAKFSIAIS